MDDPDNLRLIGRITLEYILDLLGLGLEGSGFDPVDVLILMTVSVGNVSHLKADPDLSRRFAAADAPETAEVKRPVSRVAVAEALELPRETARRKINRLEKAGLLVQVRGGLVAVFEARDPEAVVAAAARNANLLRKMIRVLERHGVTIPRDTPVSGGDQALIAPGADLAHLRIISRATMEYARTALSAASRIMGLDLIDVLITTTAAAANYGYLKYDLELSTRNSDPDERLPVDLRRPTTRNAIAAALHMPRETIRRRIARLVREGFLADKDGGVIWTVRDRLPEAGMRTMLENRALFVAMLSSLQRQGVPI